MRGIEQAEQKTEIQKKLRHPIRPAPSAFHRFLLRTVTVTCAPSGQKRRRVAVVGDDGAHESRLGIHGRVLVEEKADEFQVSLGGGVLEGVWAAPADGGDLGTDKEKNGGADETLDNRGVYQGGALCGQGGTLFEKSN